MSAAFRRDGQKIVSGSANKTGSFFRQKTAYGILRSDWSSDVCSSD
eukprot:COSAG01_NODE_24234_length_786_cov_0.532751_2_plen_45_part_01